MLSLKPRLSNSSRSTANEEPLVNAGVDGSRGELLVLGQGGELIRGDAALGVGNGEVGGGDATGGGLAGDEFLPGLVALVNDVHGVPLAHC